MIILYIN